MERTGEQIIRTEYSEIMQKSYIDYAMSVIISRALPDVRDGLKPVQRRTLYDMHELGIRYDKPYRKCARIVGDTMGKYHPHGDSSIYDALVVMAQEFKKGLSLVDGHGNFGSIEGDGAAAMRYTEARLQKITQEAFLSDLDKDVVNFLPNFDETEKEPEVLPVRLPNLLINGSDGIAVGMVTSTPPHNLGEVIDAEIAAIKNSEITTEELMEHIKGPDFPTGGIVVNKDELPEIYRTGTGKIKLRGKVEIEQTKAGKTNLVITEIPYTMMGANIGKFLNDIAGLIESKKATDIVDISNQSSKDGIRIVLELRKNADTNNLINMLYKKTRLEDTFGVNMLAVADKRPETLGLKKILEHHIDFLFEVNTRKYQTLLKKELAKKEVQEGLIKAVDVIDLIIEILRGSTSQQQAKDCLVLGITEGIRFKSRTSKKQASQLRFTEVQATAILEMRLYRLIGLELAALQKDYDTTVKNIARYEDLLNHYDSMAEQIISELTAMKKEYAKPRKTVIENVEAAVYEEKKMEILEVVFLMDRFGYARCVDQVVYDRNKEAADSENKYIIPCMNTDKICIFTDTGSQHLIRLADVPYGKFRDKGKPIDNFCNYDSNKERIINAVALQNVKLSVLIFCTEKGMIKQVDGSEMDVAKRTIAATKLMDDDKVIAVRILGSAQTCVFKTSQGYCLRIQLKDVPQKKKSAIGVRGIRLSETDKVDEFFFPELEAEKTITYKEKEVHLDKLKIAGRDTKGTKIRA